jgi:hypothetical protein
MAVALMSKGALPHHRQALATMTPRYPDAPGHRSVDTSIAAAEAIAQTLGRLQRMALEAIREAGPQGRTAEELAAVLKLDRTTVQPRTSELRRKGMIHDSGQRRQNASGKRATAWIATASALTGGNAAQNE